MASEVQLISPYHHITISLLYVHTSLHHVAGKSSGLMYKEKLDSIHLVEYNHCKPTHVIMDSIPYLGALNAPPYDTVPSWFLDMETYNYLPFTQPLQPNTIPHNWESTTNNTASIPLPPETLTDDYSNISSITPPLMQAATPPYTMHDGPVPWQATDAKHQPTNNPATPESLSGSHSSSSDANAVAYTYGYPQDLRCWEHGCNGKLFSNISNLLRHRRERAGDRDTAYCSKCGTFFTRRAARNQHERRGSCKRPGKAKRMRRSKRKMMQELQSLQPVPDLQSIQSVQNFQSIDYSMGYFA